MESSIIKAEGINKVTSQAILNNVNFTAYSGELHAIIGNNGEGKSMFAKVLSGISRKSSGTVYLNDIPIDTNSISSAQKHGIYMVQQEVHLFPTLSIRENLISGHEKAIFSSKLLMPNHRKMDDKCRQILSDFGLNMDVNRSVSSLSEGEKHMIQLIRTILCGPKVLILDEFSSSLSMAEVEQVFLILDKLKHQNVIIILISHNFSEILKHCDRLSVIEDGTIINSFGKEKFHQQSFRDQIINLHMDFKYPRLVQHAGREVLHVDHLSAGILKDITFSLHEGEILGIAGLAGSGRSTLVKAIMGYHRAEDGFIRFSKPYSSRKSVSLIPESGTDISLFHHQSVSFNILSMNFKKARRNHFISHSKMRLYTKDLIDKLGFQGVSLNSDVAHLSTGNKQKLLIARSLFNRSKIYIFDEPSKNLDSASKIELYNIYNALVIKGASILLISSDFSELVGMCNRLILLKNGIQIGEYSTDHLSLELLYRKLQA